MAQVDLDGVGDSQPLSQVTLTRADWITRVAHRINHHMYNKTLTVDSRITVPGGRNIGGERWAATTDNGVELNDQGMLERVSLEDGSGVETG